MILFIPNLNYQLMAKRLHPISLFIMLLFLFGSADSANSLAAGIAPTGVPATDETADEDLLSFPYIWNTDDCTEYFKAYGSMLGGWNFRDPYYVISGKGTNWRGSISTGNFDTKAGMQVKLSFDYATENDVKLTILAITDDGEQTIYDDKPEVSSTFRTLAVPFTASGPTAISIKASLSNSLDYGTLMLTNINFIADVPDLACERITSPSVSNIAIGSTTPVKAIFRNVSGQDIADPVFCYSYDGHTVRETYDGTVAAGAQTEHAFAEPLPSDNETEGQLKVWLESETDGNRANDTLSTDISFYEPVDFPYINNFNGDDAFSRWSIVDANGDGVAWTGGTIGEDNGMLAFPGPVAVAADYAFLPAIKMPAGESRLIFYYTTQYGRQSHLNVLMGTSPDVSTMEPLLSFDFNNRGWLAAYTLLNIPEDGVRYFAFECTNGSDAIFIDNLYIDRGEDLCMNDITFDTGSGFNKTNANVTISYINHGVNPQSDIEVKYYVNYEPVDSAVVTASVMPGDTLYYTFDKPYDISVPDSTYTLIGEIKTQVGADVQNDRIIGSSVSHFVNQKVPYSSDFEDTFRFSQWTAAPSAGGGAWAPAYTFQSYSGTNVLYHRTGGNGDGSGPDADDWAFSECIEIPAGRYELSFHYRTKMHWDGPDYDQCFKVMMGTGADSEAMTINVADFNNISVKGYAYNKFNTVVDIPENGRYYIGFYNYSTDNMGETYIDDLRLEPVTEGLPLPYTADFAEGLDEWTLYNPRNHNWEYNETDGDMLLYRSDYYATIEGTEGLMVSPKLHIEAGTEAEVNFEYCAYATNEGDTIDVALYGGTVNNPNDMKILKVYSPTSDYTTATYVIEPADEPVDCFLGLRSSLDEHNGEYTIKVKSFNVSATGTPDGVVSADAGAELSVHAARGCLTLSSPETIKCISVYDLSGRLVTRVAPDSGTATIGTAAISGVHVLKIETDSGTVIRKIVI